MVLLCEDTVQLLKIAFPGNALNGEMPLVLMTGDNRMKLLLSFQIIKSHQGVNDHSSYTLAS